MKRSVVGLTVAGAFLAVGSQAALAVPDWSKVPAGGFDKSDSENEVKATVMFPNDKVPLAPSRLAVGAPATRMHAPCRAPTTRRTSTSPLVRWI